MVRGSQSRRRRSRRAKTRHGARHGARPALPGPSRFDQKELWDLDPPVEVPEALQALATLRERFEQALAHDRARV
jgi:hypothetical protein